MFNLSQYQNIYYMVKVQLPWEAQRACDQRSATQSHYSFVPFTSMQTATLPNGTRLLTVISLRWLSTFDGSNTPPPTSENKT